MTETTDSANPPGESTQPPAESENLPAAETTSPQPAAETSLPDVNSSLPAIDSTMPADTSLPPVDSSLPSFDSSLPPIDSSVPALPAIDTSLPPLDTTLPAEDSLQLPESHSFLPETSQDDAQSTQPEDSATAPGNSSNGLPQQTDPTYQTSSNGAYQYSQPPGEQQPPQSQAQSQPPQGQPQPQPQPQPQQNDQSQPQQQYQPPQQYQPQQYQQPQYQQQPQQQPQQPVHQSYQPQQQYQQQQSPEMYNNSQAGAPPMNAGTMQNMDHNGTQGQPGHIPQAPIGSPMPSNMPPMPSGGQYMTGYPTNVSQMNMNSNYHLPGDPNKMLSGGRHKKEVKRRTKTGCLTCRKRRIKCDEGHPVCRNCVKSKRDCLGYDPVFRTQSTTPSAIQPAPNNPAPPPPPSLVVAPQQEPGPYPAAPPGYVPAVSQPFAPSLQSESSAPSSTEHNQFDYSATIDPALEGNNNAGNMASVQHATSAPDGGFQAPLNAGASVKQVQIGDLLALRGIPPPPTHPITSLPPGRLEEIQAVFLATYAPAIDRFFETPWFQEKALPHAMANAQLMADYSALIDAFNDRNLEDPNVIARLESFEASVLWSTIALCRHVMNMANGNHGQDFDLLAAAKRLDVIEALLTGDHLETNPLSQFPVRQPAADPPALSVQITQRSLDFWSCVGHFLTLHDNEASSAKEIDDTLARCRTLLDTTENRDVIYSIAIARHLGQRWVDFPHSLPQPLTTNEKDAGAKLYVAQKFLEQQASGSGTTQVSKRICGMAVRSWFVSRE